PFAYSWSLDGATIPAASHSITAGSPGSYSCRVTATNYSGSGSQLSAGFAVARPPSDISLISQAVSRSGTISLGVLLHAPGRLIGTARFSAGNRFYGAAALRETSAR